MGGSSGLQVTLHRRLPCSAAADDSCAMRQGEVPCVLPETSAAPWTGMQNTGQIESRTSCIRCLEKNTIAGVRLAFVGNGPINIPFRCFTIPPPRLPPELNRPWKRPGLNGSSGHRAVPLHNKDPETGHDLEAGLGPDVVLGPGVGMGALLRSAQGVH